MVYLNALTAAMCAVVLQLVNGLWRELNHLIKNLFLKSDSRKNICDETSDHNVKAPGLSLPSGAGAPHLKLI
jgi:hypothetical protein